MRLNKRLISYNFSSGNNPYYIVIHDTGNPGAGADANAHFNFFNGGNRDSSAHYFVDDEQCLQVVEDYNCSWHCGKSLPLYIVRYRTNSSNCWKLLRA